MTVLLGALVLLLLGLLGARFSFTWSHTPLGPRTFLMSGTHFLLVGVVLGSGPVGLLTPDVLEPLYPLLAMIIGWIGLLYGLQFDLHHLRDLPAAASRLALLQSVICLGMFATVACGALWLAGRLDRAAAAAALVAAAIAATSSPLGIAVLANLAHLRGRLSELLLFVASLDALVGIVAAQLVLVLFQPGNAAGWDPAAGLLWLLLAACLGLAFGILFLWLARTRPRGAELSLFLMGTAAFIAGAALRLGVSALFVAVGAGMLVANASPRRALIYRALQRWEKPLYVVLMVLAGALADLGRWPVWPLALGYVGLRLVSKWAGGALASRTLPGSQRPPAAFGLALATQSGMPLALLLSAGLSYGMLSPRAPAPVDIMFSTVVLAVIFSELAGPFLARYVLQRAGERVGPAMVPERHHA